MSFQNVRPLAEDIGFAEGPIISETGEVVFTAIDRGLLYRIDGHGEVAVLAETGGGPNGACDLDGDFYIAQNGGNWMVGLESGFEPPPPAAAGVQRVRADGSVDHVSTLPLAPNDICPGPDGLLYVTDPTRRRTYDDGRIWRVDPKTGESDLLYHLDWFPNGIGFGLEEDAIYVASTGAQQILRLPIEVGSSPRAGEVVIEMPFGFPDGFAFDLEGNMLVCALSKSEPPGEIQVWDTTGVLLDRFSPGPGKKYTNVALSGDGFLVITDSEGGAVLGVPWSVAGLALYPRRHRTPRAPDIADTLKAAADQPDVARGP